MSRRSTAANEVYNFDPVTLTQRSEGVLGPGHDRAVAFDGHRPVGQPQVFNEAPNGQAVGHVGLVAVHPQTHELALAATLPGADVGGRSERRGATQESTMRYGVMPDDAPAPGLGGPLAPVTPAPVWAARPSRPAEPAWWVSPRPAEPMRLEPSPTNRYDRTMPPVPPTTTTARPKRLALFGAAFVCVVVGIGGGATLARAVERRAAPAAEIEGRVVPPGRRLEPWVAELGGRLKERTVNLSLSEGVEEIALGEFGLEPDTAATVQRVRASGELGVFARLGSLFGRTPSRPEVRPAWRLDESKARAKIEALKARIDREPVNARVDLVQHERLDEVPGRELDVAETLARLAALPHEAGDVLVPALRERPAAVTVAMLGSVDVHKVLASYETTFSRRGKVAGRAVNIAVAATKLDGLVIGPGETISFNRVVGPRTEEAGFTHAPEIFDDEMKDGIGGGTCQVASTLHAAAVYGALDMVERRSHSRPSAYTPLGLDATVVDNAVDLKIKNPHPFPLLIHAYLPRPTVLRIELLGADAPSHVEYRFAATGRGEDFVRRLTFKPEMAQGEFVRKQKGHRGQSILSRVIFRWPDGRVVERSYKSDYHAVPEVLWVGPGVDESSLPDVPAGAIGVERRGLPQPPDASPAAG